VVLVPRDASPHVADRYAYVPHALLLAGLAAAVPLRRGTAGAWALSLVLPTLAITSAVQLQHWRNSESLFAQALRVTRDNHIVHYNFGVALQEQGRTREAAEQYARAVRVKPDYVDAHVNLGAMLEVLGDRAGAERQYRNALRLSPDDPDARANLDALRASGSTLPATTRPARP
jgi:protein O-mannosyl-transferase